MIKALEFKVFGEFWPMPNLAKQPSVTVLIHNCWVEVTHIKNDFYTVSVKDINNDSAIIDRCHSIDVGHKIQMAIKKFRGWNDHYFITKLLMEQNIPYYLRGDIGEYIHTVLSMDFHVRYSKDKSCWQFITNNTEYPNCSSIYETIREQSSQSTFCRWIDLTLDIKLATDFDNAFLSNADDED